MAMSRLLNGRVLMVSFAIGVNLASIQTVLAANKRPLAPVCISKSGHWLRPGTPCGPRSLGATCQRTGSGPTMVCRP